MIFNYHTHPLELSTHVWEMLVMQMVRGPEAHVSSLMIKKHMTER